VLKLFEQKLRPRMRWSRFVYLATGMNLTEPVTCPLSEWQCNSSQCIPLRWRCDGSFDCTDRSDEVGCPPGHIAPHDMCHLNGEFRCLGSNQCIHQSWVCDSDPDCEDGSDEADCKLRFSASFHASVLVFILRPGS